MIAVGTHRVSRRLAHSLVALSLLTAGASAGAQKLAARTPRPNEPSAADIQRVVDQAYARFKDLKEGKNADYIPARAQVDTRQFGIAHLTPDGNMYTAGHNTNEVSVQSNK